MNSKRILFIDDEPNVLQGYRRSLREFQIQWEMHFTTCPLEALKRVRSESFDTVVADIRMPTMDGLDFLAAVKADHATADLPVVIVTGDDEHGLKRKALDLDAADLLSKPVDVDELVARLGSALRLKESADRLKSQNGTLEERIRQRTADVMASQVDLIWRLGKAAEFRDEETGNHVIRVASYSRVIAERLAMDEEFKENLFLAAPLHDIGKIGVPDSVLLKPGKLTDDEWVMMRRHCEIGVAILSDECKFMRVATGCVGSSIPATLPPSDNPMIELATTIAATHHEKWNGQGYPRGLSGDEIPLAGRIVAVADVYDALRSERPYKTPFSVEKSLQIIRGDAGTHFDPATVEAFLEGYDEIAAIESKYADDLSPIFACSFP